MLRFRPRAALRDWPWALAVLAVLTAVPAMCGCENSCFVFISNPGGGTGGAGVGGTTGGCPTVNPAGTVQAVAHLTRTCESCSESNQIRSLILTLNGIELHPVPNQVAGPSEWQELLPRLALEPRQFVLVKSGASEWPVIPLGDRASLPAISYDWIRLRLAPATAAHESLLGTENPCGAAGGGCAVMGDGRVVPMALGKELEFPIASTEVGGGILTVLPGSDTRVMIELTPAWSAVPGSMGRLQLLPGLAGRAFRASGN